MISSEGISFPVARTCVIATLNNEICEHLHGRAEMESQRRRKGFIPYGQIIVPCTVFSVIMAFTVGFSDHRTDFMVGLLCSICILVATTVATVTACHHYRENMLSEVVDEIKRLVCDYLDELESATARGDVSAEVDVLSGNPHVSIVTVYRNTKWQRVPSLLLVEGDIIALMGGDVTPGQVQELLPAEDLHSNRGTASQPEPNVFTWRKIADKVVGRGEKIRLRKTKKSSGVGGRSSRLRNKMSLYGRRGGGSVPMSAKQRIVASNSLELLHFSGDIRCFVLKETPIAFFCRSILQNDLDLMRPTSDHSCALELDVRDILPACLLGVFRLNVQENSASMVEENKQSFIRTLWGVINSKGQRILMWLLVVLLVAAMIRFIIIPETRDQWGQVVAIPVATIAMCFFPLSLPLSLIVAEILTTASLLTSVETSLKGKPGTVRQCEVENQASLAGLPDSRPSSPYAAVSRNEAVEGMGQRSPLGSSHGSDEYKDEDIDDRAEKTAEKAYNEIYWSRLMRYIGHVGAARLSWRTRHAHDAAFESHFENAYDDEFMSGQSARKINCTLSPSELKYMTLQANAEDMRSSNASADVNSSVRSDPQPAADTRRPGDLSAWRKNTHGMLPVPFIRNRLVEMLGSINRVCFVDDDVICEDFSVTEEIFLLNSADTVKGVGARSTMLDLHANAQADGNRFEDPNWAKYLPSLKPMGLSALLTVDTTSVTKQESSVRVKTASPSTIFDADARRTPLPVLEEVHDEADEGPPAVELGVSISGIEMESARKSAGIDDPVDQGDEEMSDGRAANMSIDDLNILHEAKVDRDDALHQFSSMMLNRQKNEQISAGSLERDLILHVRNTMPLEVLRDLSEEIGFCEEDASVFTRLLEMNVLAPCLGNDRVVEDAHLWGQEQTRRRGTLVSSARAVVVDDERGGSIQLMSHGAPPLILSYCREYWDGAHITHISSADRKEILDVYGRWALEDFDVVAFGYSPLPVSLEKIVHKAYNDNLDRAAKAQYTEETRPRISSKKIRFSNSISLNRNVPPEEVKDTSASTPEQDGQQPNCLFYVDPSTEGFMHLCAVSRDRHSFKLLEEHHGEQDAAQDVTSTKQLEQQIKEKHRHHHHRHHHHHKSHSHASCPLTKAYSIGIDATDSADKFSSDPVMKTGFVDGAIYPVPESVPRSISLCEPELTKSSSVGDSSYTASVTNSAVASMLLYGNSSLSEALSRAEMKGPGDTASPFNSNNSLSKLDEDSLRRNQSDNQLYPESISPVPRNRQRSSSFSGDAPQRVDPLTVDNEDIERGYQSDPCADSTLNPTESNLTRQRVDTGYDSDGSILAPSIDEELGDLSTPTAAADQVHAAQDRSVDWSEGAQLTKPPLRRGVSTGMEHSPNYAQFHLQANNPIHHSSSDSFLLHNGGDGQHSAAALVETVFGIPVRSPGSHRSEEAERMEEDLDEYVDIESMGDSTSQVTAGGRQASPSCDTGDGNTTSVPKSPREASVPDNLGNKHGLCVNTEADSLQDQDIGDKNPSESSSNMDLLSLDSNLVQFTPGGPVRVDTSPHITLKRSASYDMASLTLAAMESDASLCEMNMKPLLDVGGDTRHAGNNALGSPLVNRPAYIPFPNEVPETSARETSLKSIELSHGGPPGDVSQEESSFRIDEKKPGKRSKRNSATSGSHSGKSNSVAGAIWPFLHEQIFLGMAASSVPVKPEAPEVLDDLQAAGIRFVFFSARNMRRSKRVAEKIGLQTDWNCAISLRALEGEESLDPNRYEWDVKARLPHGVEAIKHHINAVDNVPLLVSLFTDSTPNTIRQMINIFKEHGEVVLSVGCSYRAYNQDIFSASDVGVSVATLPGDMDIPIRVKEAASKFPSYSDHSLCQADLLLVFGLIGVGAAPLLQVPFVAATGVTTPLSDACGERSENDRDLRQRSPSTPADNEGSPVAAKAGDVNIAAEAAASVFRGVPLRLPALLESVRKCRVFLLNAYQALGSLCVCLLSLAMWPVLAQAVPMAVPPVLPVPILLIFLLLHIPVLLVNILFVRSGENVMKNTPRKRNLVTKPKEEAKFQQYLFARAGYVALSVVCIGWMASAASPVDDVNITSQMSLDQWASRLGSFQDNLASGSFSSKALSQYYHVQDVMSCQMLLGLIMQLSTMLERGQEIQYFFEMVSESLFLCSVCGLVVVHILFLVIRAALREDGFAQYHYMRYDVWLAMVVFPLFGLVIGTFVNALDEKGYRRYMQFLRLEFDTKLGMHSPK